MAALLFYQNPVPLDKETHKNLKLKKMSNLDFTSEVNAVPVSGPEFFQCSRSHPVMFAKNEKGDYIPIAMLSLLKSGHHLGSDWGDAYVPSFVRRYPFALEENQGMIMIDESAPHFNQEDGDPLFDENGEPSQGLNEVMQVLQTLDRAYQLTREYTKALVEKNLLEPCKSTIKFRDTEVKLDHLFVVDEKKFHEVLNDEEVSTWFRKAWIAWTYAHIHSIGSVNEVVKRMPR